MEKQLDTGIPHISGKVFNKTAISLGFLGFQLALPRHTQQLVAPPTPAELIVSQIGFRWGVTPSQDLPTPLEFVLSSLESTRFLRVFAAFSQQTCCSRDATRQ